MKRRLWLILKIAASMLLLAATIPVILTIVYAFVDPTGLVVARREAAGERVVQTHVPLEEISSELGRAVIMAEDARFCLHWGVDLRQLSIVVRDAMRGEATRGASTITMQLVKNLFLWPERTVLRKTLEIPLAVMMDLILSKDRILELYLNVAQFGPDHFGAEAGARHAFGVPASEVSGEEALALATVLPAPALRNARAPSARQQGVIAHVRRELRRAPWVFSCLDEPIRP